MQEDTLALIADYLFATEPEQDLFKTLYNAKPYGSYQGKAKELLDLAVQSIPKYAYQNTTFAYAMTNKLAKSFNMFIYASQSESQPKNENKKPSKNSNNIDAFYSPQEALEGALKGTKDYLGISESCSGLKTQDELLDSVQKAGESRVWGLLSSKADIEDIGDEIKKVDLALKTVQATLKSVSAISQSMLDGLEKIKTDYADFGYAYGRDLSHIDASEFANLQGKYKQIFLLKYAKGELLQETREEKKGLGDLIIAVDTSGSTQHKACGGYTILSLEMGIALAIAKIATKNRCKTRLCMHTTKIHGDSGWLQGSNNVNAYFTDIYINKKAVATGENDFDIILAGLSEWIEERQYTTKRKPGIVFITDGHDTLSDETVRRVKCLKKDFGVKLFTYFVSVSDPRSHAAKLVSISHKNYWVNASQPITTQIDVFKDLTL